jgi:hypothetical protein
MKMLKLPLKANKQNVSCPPITLTFPKQTFLPNWRSHLRTTLPFSPLMLKMMLGSKQNVEHSVVTDEVLILKLYRYFLQQFPLSWRLKSEYARVLKAITATEKLEHSSLTKQIISAGFHILS